MGNSEYNSLNEHDRNNQVKKSNYNKQKSIHFGDRNFFESSPEAAPLSFKKLISNSILDSMDSK